MTKVKSLVFQCVERFILNLMRNYGRRKTWETVACGNYREHRYDCQLRIFWESLKGFEECQEFVSWLETEAAPLWWLKLR